MRVFVFWYCLLVLMACSSSPTEDNAPEHTLFRLREQAHTNINFNNQLEYTEQLNPYTFKNFYNGGGVGLGDFNNDGLLDIFFSGNLVSNSLYLNKGNFQFQNVSREAGLSKSAWTTGVSIADINADGFLDIYLCKSGPPGGVGRHNELFINNGDMTFSEQSKKYGLDFEGLSTHAAFFDYDKDGDLDCYLLNNSMRSVGAYDLRRNQRDIPDLSGGNKLLRNDGGKFVDVTLSAGIYSSEIGFGLGVSIGDINKDGWSDIYISNDFFERDYLYINQGNGKFKESLEASIREISLGSMGADIADINNDGFSEIFVTEMLPERDDRLKTTSQFESWDKYSAALNKGYYRQFSRNVLQLNNANGTFSDIARLAGVQATDWSWGALIFDMNNDGFKDIFVANGIYKDLLDQDYVNFVSDRNMIREILLREGAVIKQLIDSIPSNRIANYAFENKGNLFFDNKAMEWGLDNPTHSNGAAYGDLDNDGDLDLVLNNVNMEASIYENQSESIHMGNVSLSVMLHGIGENTFALGSKVTLKGGGKLFYQEHSPMRGFMSSVDYKLNFGLGDIQIIDSVIVEWPNDQVTIQTKVLPNQLLHIYQKDHADLPANSTKTTHSPILVQAQFEDVVFQHLESEFADFDRERLLFNMISNEGPCLCVGDLNGDGLEDFFVGGAKNQAGSIFVQKKSGGFTKLNTDVFDADKASEDTDCIFFDANGDGRQDLYVTSGGNEFSGSSTAFIDRLYFNMKNGTFKKSHQILPTATRFESTSTVEQNDYDHDGDLDLFVGARVIPGLYGVPCNGYILNNDGKGNFVEAGLQLAPGMKDLGLIRDAKWVDVDNDSYSDLVVVGEWMEIILFRNRKGKAFEVDLNAGFNKTNGWYNALETGDFNGDGWIDLVTGNHGLNSRFKASESEPLKLYVNDFDKNGSVEHVTTRYVGGKSLPLVLRQDMVMQMPFLKKKYLYYKNYVGQTISDIFTPDQLNTALVLNAFTMETALWLNNGDGTFRKRALPVEAQFSPVYAMLIDDFDGDKKLDIMMGGNLYRAKPETGIYDGSYGVLLKGDGNGSFTSVPSLKSGISITGEVRGLKTISDGKKNILIVAKNNDHLQFFKY